MTLDPAKLDRACAAADGLARRMDAFPRGGDKGRSDAGSVRIVHNKILGGWFVVRGTSDTPISGRFPTKEAAQASLKK